MSELLSAQIGAFRRSFGRFVDDGVGLTGEAVEAFDSLFASFQAQALASGVRRAAEPRRFRGNLPHGLGRSARRSRIWRSV